jgi:hypothetical protein
MTQQICTGIAKSGLRCRARALPDSAFCVTHSPAVSDEVRRQWRAKGGKNSANRIRFAKQMPGELMSLEEVDAYLGVVYRAVIHGKLDARIATAAATVASTMKELRKAAIEERLEEIEQVLGIAKRRAS